MEGSFDKLGKKEEVYTWNGVNGYDLQKIISDQGIVKMENPERPLAEMISKSRKEEKITLVVRCVFDDPWLAADYSLCRDRMNAVIEGAGIVAKACLKVLQIVFVVSYRDKQLGQELLSKAGKLEIPSLLVLTGSRYPQRKCRELELALRVFEKKEKVNLGSLLILGPAVLAAAYDAVVYKKPVLDRYVAVGGSAVKTPQIMKIRIGTRIGDIIEQCGGFIDKPEKIITGSPFSGREVVYLDEPVGKTCYAIVAMSKSQAAIHAQQNCINCGECRLVCPARLDPQSIYKLLVKQSFSKKIETDYAITSSCHGCGCCNIVCPSALPLLETIFKNKEEESGARAQDNFFL
jgi:electron transport complex protein RnfC